MVQQMQRQICVLLLVSLSASKNKQVYVTLGHVGSSFFDDDGDDKIAFPIRVPHLNADDDIFCTEKPGIYSAIEQSALSSFNASQH